MTIGAGLLSRRVLHGLPAKLAGDALYTALVYLLALGVRPRWSPRRAGAVALAISAAVELFQLTPYPALLSARHVLLRLVFGTTFGWVDLLGYLIGATLGALAHGAVTEARARRRA